MTTCKNLGDQKLIGRALNPARKWYSSQLLQTTYFQHALTSVKRVRL